MPITFTIDNQNQQTLALIEYLKTLSFVKFTESTTPITKGKATAKEQAIEDDLEEDEYGIPIKYRDKIMELSRKTNKAIAKRWDEALSKRNETVEI
ncbi:glutaredoxin-2 domain protein [uncultured Capnocytophaga sp.]|uniref:glutaredoxin-2 domain protein n=1 Tax=uncultured Capnocytophaga sp. TaxID=159273 RepID=UPI00261EF5BA|nr:glutaredoxin-2 domain protein [uncultured Capnocytophaga sp.]